MPAKAADEKVRRRDDGAREHDEDRARDEHRDVRQKEQKRARQCEREQHQWARKQDDRRPLPSNDADQRDELS
jgi:hypothetical protein